MLFTSNKDEKSCDEKELIWQEAWPRLKVAAFASTRAGNRRWDWHRKEAER
jgi:hypothetical protein